MRAHPTTRAPTAAESRRKRIDFMLSARYMTEARAGGKENRELLLLGRDGPIKPIGREARVRNNFHVIRGPGQHVRQIQPWTVGTITVLNAVGPIGDGIQL